MEGKEMNVVIISAACCVPAMASFDEQARKVIERAISETGIDAAITIVPATTALFGGVSAKIVAELMTMFNRGKVGAPAILIDGEAVSYGVPQIEDMKSALKRFLSKQITKEESQ